MTKAFSSFRSEIAFEFKSQYANPPATDQKIQPMRQARKRPGHRDARLGRSNVNDAVSERPARPQVVHTKVAQLQKAWHQIYQTPNAMASTGR